jgi:hypothetical protein
MLQKRFINRQNTTFKTPLERPQSAPKSGSYVPIIAGSIMPIRDKSCSRNFMRLTLPNMSMVIISASCLIVKQMIEHPGQF